MRGRGESEGTWITAQRCTRVYTRFTHTTSSGLSCSSVMNLISSAKPVSDTLKMTKQATRSCPPSLTLQILLGGMVGQKWIHITVPDLIALQRNTNTVQNDFVPLSPTLLPTTLPSPPTPLICPPLHLSPLICPPLHLSPSPLISPPLYLSPLYSPLPPLLTLQTSPLPPSQHSQNPSCASALSCSLCRAGPSGTPHRAGPAAAAPWAPGPQAAPASPGLPPPPPLAPAGTGAGSLPVRSLAPG